MKWLIILPLFLIVLGGCKMEETNTQVKLETNQGDIVIELYKEMPITPNLIFWT